jgi:hypothetical protein
MNLIRLAPGNVYPLINLALNQIGTATGLRVEPINADGTSLRLSGQGSLVNQSADNVVYAHTQRSTGYQIDVTVDQITSEGGIMIRQSLDPGSPMLYLYCNESAGNRVEVEYRSAQGANRVLLPGFLDGALPMRLRVQRYGKVIRALASIDGIHYTELAEVELATGPQYVGLTTLSSGMFSGYHMTGYTPLAGVIKYIVE